MKKTIAIKVIQYTILLVIIYSLSSCKVTPPQHTNCKNQKNCPHTNKRYYIEKIKNKNLFW